MLGRGPWDTLATAPAIQCISPTAKPGGTCSVQNHFLAHPVPSDCRHQERLNLPQTKAEDGLRGEMLRKLVRI